MAEAPEQHKKPSHVANQKSHFMIIAIMISLLTTHKTSENKGVLCAHHARRPHTTLRAARHKCRKI